MKKWKIALIIIMCVGIIGIGCVGYKTRKPIDYIDYTDSFTKELLKNPEPYVGEEVTLTLDKEKYFPNVDVWGQTRKSVEQEGNELIVRYDGGRIIIVGDFPSRIALMNIGPTVNIEGAKAVKLTGMLERGGLGGSSYKLEAYKIEPIY